MNWTGAKPHSQSRRHRLERFPSRSGYLLIEALAYTGLVVVLLGVAYAGLYRFIDNTVVLHRSLEDISGAMHAGERWRADVRAATGGLQLQTNAERTILKLSSPRGEIAYTLREGAVLRRVGAGPWVRVLSNVRASSMQPDVQPAVTGWRWELELQPQTKGIIKPGRIRPLFTFSAAPPPVTNP